MVHAADGRKAIDPNLCGHLEYQDAINLKSVTKWTAKKLLLWNANDSYCMYQYDWIQCNCLEDVSSCKVSVYDADGKFIKLFKNDTGSVVRLNVDYSKNGRAYTVNYDDAEIGSVHQLLCHRYYISTTITFYNCLANEKKKRVVQTIFFSF